MNARRAWSTAGLSGTAALLAAAGGATWYYASRLIEPPALEGPPVPRAVDRVEVAAVGDATVALAGSDAARPGVWGLSWDGGYGRVSTLVPPAAPPVPPPRPASASPPVPASASGPTSHQELTTRAFELLAGDPPLPGTPAVLDAYAYPHDPEVLGLRWEEVAYDSPVGPTPAWCFPNERDTWVVFVHGRSGRRHEAFRMLPTVHALGLPALSIAYRNDADAPRSQDGRSHLGATEWEDVEAAVAWARDHGARDVIPVGFSMGGACVVNFARLSPLAQHIRGAILDAPVLDWGPVIRAAAVDRGLPASVLPWLLPATMRLAGARANLDWARMRHDPDSFVHPKLLIHGDADATVPVELADALAEARPDIVTYLRVAGAGHVRSWNADPVAYATAVRGFIDTVAPPGRAITGPPPRR